LFPGLVLKLQPAGAVDYLASPWQISADRLTHLRTPEKVVAEGSVLLERKLAPGPPMTIEADWLQYEIDAARVTARGNIRIKSGEDLLTAEEAEVNLDDQTGVLQNGALFVARSNLQLSGARIEKTGDFTYHLENGWFSTCQTSAEKKAAWSFESRDTRVTVDGYAVLKDSYLRVRGVPVFYLPYLILPAKTTRQSGLLFPELSQSDRDGTGLLLPFFVNLSPSADLTLYPGHLTERGPMVGFEFRYAADYNSKGSFIASFLHDGLEETPDDEFKSDGRLRTEDDRYWVRGKADHDFGHNWWAKLDLDLVSDRDYLEEFEEGLIGFDRTNSELLRRFGRGFQEETIPFRDSSFQLTKLWSSSFFGSEVRAVDDESNLGRNFTAIQTLPRFLLSGLRTGEAIGLPLLFDWDSEYLHYWREEGIGAHRLDLHPQLATTLPLGRYLEGSLAYGIQQTFYEVENYGDDDLHPWNEDDSPDRTLYDFNATVATTLVRDFSFDIGALTGLEHLLRPELSYQYVPPENQEELPDLDIFDRITAQNRAGWAFTNFFNVSGTGDNDLAFRRYLGWLKISQSYDIREDRRELAEAADGEQRPWSDLFFELEVLPLDNFRLKYDTSLSIYGQGVTHYDLIGRYISHRGDMVALEYRYNRIPGVDEPFFFTADPEDSVHELNLSLVANLRADLTAMYEISRSFATSRTIESALRFTYHPACWAVELLASTTPDEERVALLFSLAGIGKILEFGLPEL